jgi:hypothetical protein
MNITFFSIASEICNRIAELLFYFGRPKLTAGNNRLDQKRLFQRLLPLRFAINGNILKTGVVSYFDEKPTGVEL